MNKISIIIHNGYITFNKFNKSISEDNLNNTNVIDVKNIKFTEQYILENIDLVSAFLNLVILKSEVKKVKIKSLDISETILKLLKTLSIIEEITFTEDKELNYSISSLLLENKNLKKIECYSLPEIMFYRFPKDMIDTRCEFLFLSNFMKNNNINTYSSLCNKDKISIDGNISKYDIEDLKYFFQKNKNLDRIFITNYLKNSLIKILELLNENKITSITIIVCENRYITNEILNDIQLFEKLSKKYKVKIKIKYSREYKTRNRVKEINIKLFRYILIAIIVILSLSIVFYKQKEIDDNNNLKDNVELINQTIEEVQLEEIETYDVEVSHNLPSVNSSANTDSYVSSYYKNYDKVYQKLLTINSDTVGWLTVNNTNINYPIVQTYDNAYYLKHAYDKANNNAGWLFVDYRNDMDEIDKNTIIYGHNIIKNGVMFGTLNSVLNPDWYGNENNLKIVFNIKDNSFNWQVFSIYVIDKTSDYLYTDFSSNEDFLDFINTIKSRSINDFGINFNEDDKILTLSTCYENSGRRLVLHAKLIK